MHLLTQEEDTTAEDHAAVDTLPDLASTPPATAEPNRRIRGGLVFIILTALFFLNNFAFPYLSMDAARFGIYASRRDWLLAHIVGGTIALLLGPVQMWLAISGRNSVWHRVLGIVYVMGVAMGSSTAFYLAFHSQFGWVFGLGLTALALAWLVTTALAVAAICLYMVQQHWEWMIRSYVLTFAFVVFRGLTELFDIAKIGTTAEQLTAASWLCWSVPLLITESILQGRKIFKA